MEISALINRPQPPIQTLPSRFDLDDDIRDRFAEVGDALRLLADHVRQSGAFMADASAVLAASIYKNHNRFRRDKAFNGLKMVSKAVGQLEAAGLPSSAEAVRQCLPIKADLRSRAELRLPSRQMVESLLVRLQWAFAKAERVCGLCEHAKRHLDYRMRLGHFWSWAAFGLATVGRIWALSQALMVNYHQAYIHVAGALASFPSASVEWLPDSSRDGFPAFLIDPDSMDPGRPVVESLMKTGKFVVRTKRKPTQQAGDNVIGRKVARAASAQHAGNDAIGRKVARAALAQPCSARDWKRYSAAAGAMERAGDVEAFIAAETALRKSCRKKAVTVKLDQTQWRSLRGIMRNSELAAARNQLMSWLLFPKDEEKRASGEELDQVRAFFEVK